jgi:hypothetical protein
VKLTDQQILNICTSTNGPIEFARAIADEQLKIDAEICKQVHNTTTECPEFALYCAEAILKEGV